MDIHSVENYIDIGKLIEEQCPDYVNNVESEVMDYLNHINDFDCISYLVINGDLVVTYDRLNGQVLDRQGIVDFIELSVDYARTELGI